MSLKEIVSNYPEEYKNSMYGSLIMRALEKSEPKFFSFQEIVSSVKEVEWTQFECISPALEDLIFKQRLEYDPTYGYCRAGCAERLRKEMKLPYMNRTDFDNLTVQAKHDYLQGGGIIR